MSLKGLWILTLVLAAGCDQRFPDPPAEPPHVVSNDGTMHAARYRTPFLCGSASGGSVECPKVRPADALLACDSAGCHGSFTYGTVTATTTRDVLGSEGPSCYTCHENEWARGRGD